MEVERRAEPISNDKGQTAFVDSRIKLKKVMPGAQYVKYDKN